MRSGLCRWLAVPTLFWSGLAAAHLIPNTEVRLAFGAREVVADIVIPQGEYAYATGNPVDGGAVSLAAADAFLRQKVRVRTPRGVDWQVALTSLAFDRGVGLPALHAVARYTPPPDASARRLVLDWQAILDTRSNHFVLVAVASDFSAGKLDDQRQILGALQSGATSLVIDRGDASLAGGFAAAVWLGMRHIAAGYDHLLFLIALLLPAPLIASSGRWVAPRPARSTLASLAWIVSAFSAGHSLTLIGAAAFSWQLPAQPVEILIALSILISAIHAARPLFPGREAIVAAGFGLVHGLAFATVVGNFGLGVTEKSLSILGFNLGIELVQFAVVLLVAPSLLLLARTHWYPLVRSSGAAFAGIAALAWLAERAW